MAAMSSVITVLPSPDLREYVSRYVERSERLGRGMRIRPVTATPDVRLVFHLEGPSEAFEYQTGRTRVLPTALVVGPQTGRSAELLESGDRAHLIVSFQPGGFYRLFHVPLARITDTACDAREILGADAGRLREHLSRTPTGHARAELVNRFLSTRLADARPRHPSVDAALALVDSHGARRVSEVGRATGLSPRQFERSFREHMGVSPKLFARAARLEFALQLKRGNPSHTWTRVSQEAGYFDQTHFVKDFKALAGETPSTFPLIEQTTRSMPFRRPA